MCDYMKKHTYKIKIVIDSSSQKMHNGETARKTYDKVVIHIDFKH